MSDSPVRLSGLQLPQQQLGVVGGGRQREWRPRGRSQHVVRVPRLPTLAVAGRACVFELGHMPVPAYGQDPGIKITKNR